ncbi:cytochrome bd oxidase small subunit CydS [Lysinibacillus xylanilyticus]
MEKFLMFYAPFIVVILGIVFAFWWAPRDHHVTKEEGESRE